jgi:hypothetical protein
VYLGQLVIDPEIEDKLHRKHKGITFADVVEAIQWPAKALAAWEDHPVHGRRVVALGTVASGRRVICCLDPIPDWDEYADTWKVRTARWVD